MLVQLVLPLVSLLLMGIMWVKLLATSTDDANADRTDPGTPSIDVGSTGASGNDPGTALWNYAETGAASGGDAYGDAGNYADGNAAP